MGIRHDAAVIEKDVDMILGGQECADIAMQDEIRLGGALDRLGHLGVGSMNEIAHLLTDRSLPRREAIDVRLYSRVSAVRHLLAQL